MNYNIDRSRIITRPVKVTFLEMHEKPKESLPVKEGATFILLGKPIDVATYRKYYYGVGEKYYWLDRMVMPDEMLAEKINAANTDIYLMYYDNEPAGYAEFIKEKEFTEVLYFGLLPAFIGKGIGKYFLQWVVQQAWSYKPKWIQLNTCELDHPHALPNYKNAGFKEVRTAMEERKILLP
ncbi:MAG: GNAT family N-acetyltransferase [Chitinophagaceae bacterium]|nr:GNAT family N-acetyltransferase [Chitinophagaceae bacterium]